MNRFTLNLKYFGITFIVVFITSIVNQNFAQTLTTYSWTANNCSNTSATSSTGLTISPFTRGNGLSCSSIAGGFNSTGWKQNGNFTSARNQDSYVEFSLTTDANTPIVINSLLLKIKIASGGPATAQVYYYIGTTWSDNSSISFGNSINTSNATSITDFTISPTSTISLSASQKITFRIYGWGGSSSSMGFYTGSAMNGQKDFIFKSKSSGNWNSTSSWYASLDGTTWSNAQSTPNNNSKSITIQNEHSISVTSSVTADEISINSGGTLSISSGVSLTVANGTGTDLINNGTLNIQGTIVGSSGPSIVFGSGATLITNNTSGVNGALANFASRTFSTSNDNNFTFNATGNQNTGTMMPSIVNGITISGSGSKTLTQKTTLLPTGTVTVTSAVFNLNNDSLILQSNASSTARVATSTGSFTNASKFSIQRFIPSGSGRFWWHLSSPVSNTFVSDWQNEFYITGNFPNTSIVPHATTSTASLKYYDESVSGDLNNGWVEYPKNINSNSAPLVVGRGYIAFIRTGQTSSKDKLINVTGTPNVGSIDYNVQFHSSGNILDDGWNLLGNPYPSDIDWANAGWARTNVDDAVYVWNAKTSSYSSFVNGLGVNEGTGKIPSSHAFWVKTNGSNPSLTSTETVKTATQNIFTKQAVISNLLRVKLKDDIAWDEIAIRFDEDATNSFDNSYDAYSMTGPNFGLSTTSEDSVSLSINTLSEITDSLIIPINSYFSKNINYRLEFSNVESFEGDKTIYLIDKLLNKTSEIKDDTAYTFSVTSNLNNKNRFEIAFRKAQTTAIYKPKDDLNFTLYPNPSDGNHIIFTFAENLGKEYQISIIDMLGKVVMSKTSMIESGPNSLIMDSKLPSGIYVVNCITNEKTATKTLVIK